MSDHFWPVGARVEMDGYGPVVILEHRRTSLGGKVYVVRMENGVEAGQDPGQPPGTVCKVLGEGWFSAIAEEDEG